MGNYTDYSAPMWNEEYIKRMMQGTSPMPNSPQVASSPTPTLQMLYGNNGTGSPMLNRTPTTPTTGWMDYAGLGAAAAAPVAGALLSRTPQRQEYAASSSLGQKPTMQFQYPYGQMPKLTPSMLARLLMGVG